MALAACGGADSGEDVADDWVAALNDRDWGGACELRYRPAADCEQDARRSFDGGRVALQPPRSYSEGGRLNDNETTFAFYAEGARASAGFFEIVDGRVDLQIVVTE